MWSTSPIHTEWWHSPQKNQESRIPPNHFSKFQEPRVNVLECPVLQHFSLSLWFLPFNLLTTLFQYKHHGRKVIATGSWGNCHTVSTGRKQSTMNDCIQLSFSLFSPVHDTQSWIGSCHSINLIQVHLTGMPRSFFPKWF